VVAIRSVEIEYHGRNAHAAAFPWDGVNALDALVLAYNGISMLRQHLRHNARVHGVIRNGGAKPNIIPDFTSAEFYIRARNDAELEELTAKVMACFEGAATATGCRFEFRWTGRPFSNLTTIPSMAEAYRRNAASLGVIVPDRDDDPMATSPGSTDMGNVSHVTPSIHPYFAIPTDASNHTPEFTAAAATQAAHEAMLKAGKAMAMTALDLYSDSELLYRIRNEFEDLHKG
jgi:metal-dependent amidase/aminoacylase/carboxypeptidase family protein